MYYEIYLDAVFVTNLVMDYILLRLTCRLLDWKISPLRSLLGAAVGALGWLFTRYHFVSGVVGSGNGANRMWSKNRKYAYAGIDSAVSYSVFMWRFLGSYVY